MFRLKFNNLICTKTSGWVTKDDVYLNIDNNKVWGNYVMNTGTTVSLSDQSSKDFVSPLKLDLYDHNIIGSDTFLGSVNIVANNFGNGQQSAVFNQGGANYTLNYEISSLYFLEFIELKCIKTEGTFTHDQIYLMIGSNKVWGNYDMNNGYVVSLTDRAAFLFEGSVTLKLYDHNAISSDDFLGSNNVSSPIGQQVLNYSLAGANYNLTVNVSLPLDYLVSKINKIVGYPAQGNIKAIRQNLGIDAGLTIQIDVGGEGYKEEGTVISGFKAAINLNNSDHTTTTPPYKAIANLVKITDWKHDFPFEPNFADYVTMQGAPLTDENVQHIGSIINKHGEIGLWVDDSYKDNIAKLAKLINATKIEDDCFDESPKSGYKKIRIIANKP